MSLRVGSTKLGRR